MPSIAVYFNLHSDHFFGYTHGHPIQKVFSYEAPSTGGLHELAHEAFHAFNAPLESLGAAYSPIAKRYRAARHRSLSVGDVLKIGDTWLACASACWVELDQAHPDIDLLVVTPDGEVRDEVVPADETRLITASSGLQALYEQIGCAAVDVVRLSPDTDMWVDDEGLLRARPRINQLASYIATRFGRPFQLYVGTAVFTGGADQAGYTLPLSKPARQVLLDLIDELRSIPGSGA